MASLKMLKVGLYHYSGSQSSSRRNTRNVQLGCSDFDARTNVQFHSNKLLTNRTFRVSCRIQDDDNNRSNGYGEEPPESLFMKELKRRGMTPTSLLDESWIASNNNKEIMRREEDGNNIYRNTISTDLEENLSNQKERSMALNSEGLEGLIPRAKLLLGLGGTFFLAFWPLILVTIASFSAIYLYLGPKFIHDGTTRHIQLPQYIDPYALLEDEQISETSSMLK